MSKKRRSKGKRQKPQHGDAKSTWTPHEGGFALYDAWGAAVKDSGGWNAIRGDKVAGVKSAKE